jgi:hypothetical protein
LCGQVSSLLSTIAQEVDDLCNAAVCEPIKPLCTGAAGCVPIRCGLGLRFSLAYIRLLRAWYHSNDDCPVAIARVTGTGRLVHIHTCKIDRRFRRCVDRQKALANPVTEAAIVVLILHEATQPGVFRAGVNIA